MDIESRRRGEQGHAKLLRTKRAQRSISREVRLRLKSHPTNFVPSNHPLFPRFLLFAGAIGEEGAATTPGCSDQRVPAPAAIQN